VKGAYISQGSADYHGYWGLDFTTIDPHLGTEQDFKDFVSSAHELGLKVIVDIVVNHTADIIQSSTGFNDYVELTTTPYKDCSGKSFDVTKVADKKSFPKLCANKSFPLAPHVPTFYKNVKSPAFLNDVTNYHNRGNNTWNGDSNIYGDFFGLDDLFTEKPAVLQGEIDLWSGWITKYNIDGYRIDTVKHVNKEFWQAFIPAILKAAHAAGKSTFPIFGEVAESDPNITAQFVTEYKLPSILDFAYQPVALRFASSIQYGEKLAGFFNSDDMYTTATSSAYGLTTFLGNHDMGRSGATIYNANRGDDPAILERAKLANALLFFTRGAPVIYYGDEKGMTGDGGDKAARQDMFPTQVTDWQSEYRIGASPIGSGSSFDVHNPLEDDLADLTSLQAKYPQLKSGTMQIRYGSGSQFALTRFGDNQEFLAAFNDADKAATISIPVSTTDSTWSPLAGAATNVSENGNKVTLTLAERQFVLLKADKKFAPQTKLAISLIPTKIDGFTPGWFQVAAKVPGDDYTTVSFAARVAGTSLWHSLGSTDRRTFDDGFVPAGLYRSYIHRTMFASGKKLEIVAVAKSSTGEVLASKIQNFTIKY
jgi:glycosidase